MSTSQKETPTLVVRTEAGVIKNTHELRIVAEAEAQRKRFATLQARAAITGNVLSRISDGYLLHRGSYSRHFIDLDAVDALIVRMEGRQS